VVRRKGKGGPTSAPPGTFTFKATIGRTWLIYTVDIPERVSAGLGSGKVPVVFTMGKSTPRKTTLTPRSGGGHRMAVHGESRREVAAGEGDRVTITLWREMDVLDVFRTMGPAVQRELVAYVENAKRDETRRKYIARIVERALAEREKRIDREAREQT
jgi:hypothetical protein